jgi:hypothetical protein
MAWAAVLGAIAMEAQDGPERALAGESAQVSMCTGLVVEIVGPRYSPDPARVVVGQRQADAGGSTSVRNVSPEHLEWKREGYFQRNRDLGQVITAPRDFTLEAIVLRTGPSEVAVRAGAPGAPVFIQFFEVEGEPQVDDSGTPPGTPASHGFSTNHRCDDVLSGVRYLPRRVVVGGTFPQLPTGCDGRGVYLRWRLDPPARPRWLAGRRYAFMVGFLEAGEGRSFTLANRNAAGIAAPPRLGDVHDAYPDGWAIRREDHGLLPPKMVPGARPPEDPTVLRELVQQAVFPSGPARFGVSPTTDGYPDVDTYRDLEFYLEAEG